MIMLSRLGVPCKAELNAIAEEYEDWVDETELS